MVTIDQVKQLREETAASITDCSHALKEAGGDFKEAKEILKKKGKDLAGKKSCRQTPQGIIESYIHPNKKVGVLLEINCETDFVGKSNDFQNLAHEICLQIAAMGEETPILEQAWIKDTSRTIKDLIDGLVGKVGENIVVKRFIRYDI